jgi:hypothetical protein
VRRLSTALLTRRKPSRRVASTVTRRWTGAGVHLHVLTFHHSAPPAWDPPAQDGAWLPARAAAEPPPTAAPRQGCSLQWMLQTSWSRFPSAAAAAVLPVSLPLYAAVGLKGAVGGD